MLRTYTVARMISKEQWEASRGDLFSLEGLTAVQQVAVSMWKDKARPIRLRVVVEAEVDAPQAEEAK